MRATTLFTPVLSLVISFALLAPAAQATPPPQKEWTFLLFLNGHNNLDSFGKMNINQMEQIGSTDQLNMVVQWASLQNRETKRLYIEKDSSTDVTSPVLETMAPVDMGDYKKLVEFVRWGVERYPAKRYFIAVWNHGNGWHRWSLGTKDISYDDLTGNKITTEQLGIAMAESAQFIGHKVDIYGSDACLMAMAEVAAEMKDSVHVFAGSEDYEPGEGWPYNTFMRGWAARPTMTAQEVGAHLAKVYLEAYSGGIYGDRDVTLSAIDLTHMDAMLGSMKAFSAELLRLDPATFAKVETAMQGAQAFTPEYRDLLHFVGRAEKLAPSLNSQVLGDLMANAKKMVIAVESSDAYRNATGMTLWMPLYPAYYSQYIGRYRNLAFDQSTGWSQVLDRLQESP